MTWYNLCVSLPLLQVAVMYQALPARPMLPLLQLSPVLWSFIIAALVGAVVHYCTVRRKCDCQKFYSLTIARKQQQQQPAPVYEDIVGQSQNIELKENVAYGPVQQ